MIHVDKLWYSGDWLKKKDLKNLFMEDEESKINVLMIWPGIKLEGNTGGSVHLKELSKELGDLVSLKVACRCEEDFERDGIEYYDIGSSGIFGISVSLFSFFELWRLSKNVDIIHSRSDPFELAGPIIGYLRNIPVVGEVNINFLAYEKKRSRRDLLYPLFHLIKYLWLRLVTKKLDKVLCVSNSIRNELQDVGFSKDKLEVVYNGGNPSRFKNLNKEEARNQLSLPKKDYIVLLMGELGPRHGLEKLIDIDSDDVTFLIVGGIDKYEEHLEDMKMKAPENFIFHKPVPYTEIKKYIIASDVTVAPYRTSDNDHEFGYCPIKILDSIAAGRPVVASNTPWIKEILSEEEGIVTDNLEEGILELRDSNLRDLKGKNALEKSKSELTWRHTAENILEIYNHLLKR